MVTGNQLSLTLREIKGKPVGLSKNRGGKDDEGKWKVEEAERYEWGKRVREVEQDGMGNIYVLEDKEGARLIKLQLPE